MEHPNILLIPTDDLEYNDDSFHGLEAIKNPEQRDRMQNMLIAWNSGAINPLWKEAPEWIKVRCEDRKFWIETGKRPRDVKEK